MKLNAHPTNAALIYFLVIINSYTVTCDRCGRNEFLNPKPLCCEPTCTDDCASASSRGISKNEPTCVCLPGFVRHKGRCIRKICCPKNVTDCDEVPSTACTAETTTVTTEPHRGGNLSRKKVKFTQKAESLSESEDSIPENEQLIYILKTDAGRFYRIESVKQPRRLASYRAIEDEHDFEYHSPVNCEATTEEQPKRVSNPIQKKGLYSRRNIPKTYVAKPPKCNRTQELVFCRPCCVPTCDNDCTNADRCSRAMCIAELSCACLSGYVLHDGKCVRKEECPREDYEEEDVSEEMPAEPADPPKCDDVGDDYDEDSEPESDECDCADHYYN